MIDIYKKKKKKIDIYLYVLPFCTARCYDANYPCWGDCINDGQVKDY